MRGLRALEEDGRFETRIPGAIRAARDAANARSCEGLWYRNSSSAGGFLALANTSGAALPAKVTLSGLQAPVARDLSLTPHGSALIDLQDFFAGDTARTGGVTISHAGSPGALQVAGGMQDLTSGYSAELPLLSAKTSAGAVVPCRIGSAGMMVNEQDPLLDFPPGLAFFPYAFFRNISSGNRVLHFAVYYMDGRTVKDLSLPDLTLAPGEARELAVRNLLSKQTQVEGMNLLVSYAGDYGDIIPAIGSTDVSGNYVFPVPPQAVAPSGPKMSVYWLAADGYDTMYTVWNPLNTPEDLLLTLNYGSAGETYRLPLHLEPYASEMIDIGELVRTQQLDPYGSRLPADVKHGSLTLTGAAGGPEDLITAVLNGGIYNPRKATCGNTCEMCNGMTSVSMTPGDFCLGINATRQSGLSYTYYNGTRYDVTSNSNWSSTYSSVASVQTHGQTSPGLGTGVASGSTTFNVYYGGPVPVNAGQICTQGTLPPCPTTTINNSENATVQVPGSVRYVNTVSQHTLGSSDCGAGNAGFWRDVTLQLMDQGTPPAPLKSAGFTMADSFQIAGRNDLGIKAGQVGSYSTNGYGQWPDTLYLCSSACVGSGGTSEIDQSWKASGTPLGRTNRIVYSCSSITYDGN